jgi:hypothetical protein
VWRKSSTGGACQPTNGITERAALTCPGFNTKLLGQPSKSGALVRPRYGEWDNKALGQLMRDAGQYADSTFSCSSQAARYQAQLHKCEKAMQHYYLGCAASPDRPIISIHKCPAVNALYGPVMESAITVTVVQGEYDGTSMYSISKDQRLPLEWDQDVDVHANQKAIKIQLAQKGKDGTTPLYEAEIGDLPHLGSGRKLEVHVSVKVDEKHKLTGSVKVVETSADPDAFGDDTVIAQKVFGPLHLDRPDIKTTSKANVGAPAQQPRAVDAASSRHTPSASAPVLKETIGILTRGGTFYSLIPARHGLPVTYAKTFANAEANQKEIQIQLAQKGEGGTKKFFDAVLGDLPPRPAGKLEVRIKLKVDAKKNLTLSANIPETGYYKEFGPFAVK